MRQGIFTDKAGGDRIQGIITKTGSTKFERARKRLAQIAGWTYDSVSDGDVVEYLARGDANTREYLKAKEKEGDAA